MFSTTLVRLIDESIVPALALVISKVAGVLLVSQLLELSFEIEMRGKLIPLPSIAFLSRPDYIKANVYSNLIMFAVVVIGFSTVLIRAHHFHSSHVHPHLAAKLERLGLTSIIGDTVEVYHQAVVWLLFTWFVVILMALTSLSGFSYFAVVAIAFLIALNLTWLLVFDVEREIIISRTSET
jgi:hypothetical protein